MAGKDFWVKGKAGGMVFIRSKLSGGERRGGGATAAAAATATGADSSTDSHGISKQFHKANELTPISRSYMVLVWWMRMTGNYIGGDHKWCSRRLVEAFTVKHPVDMDVQFTEPGYYTQVTFFI
jgi:hypothetical protein